MENIKFVQDLQKQICTYQYQSFSHIVILCIGTNKVMGDCIGPMTGQKLKAIFKEKKCHENIIIYGDMEDTLNFKNAKQVIEDILKYYENPFIITIDSALGSEKMIKTIVVNEGWIQIGNSLGKGISYYSHINVKGVVEKNRKTPQGNMEALEKVSPEIVIELSNIVATNIEKIISKIEIAN